MFSLRVATPLPENLQLLSAQVGPGLADIEAIDDLNGYSTLKVVVAAHDQSYLLPNPTVRNYDMAWRPYAHVRLLYETTLIFEGYAGKPARLAGMNGYEARGYGQLLTRTKLIDTSDTRSYSREAFVRLLLERYAPRFSVGTLDALGGTQRFSDIDRLSVAEMLDQIAKQGTSQGSRIVWRVREGPTLDVTVVPDRDGLGTIAPDYEIPWASPLLTKWDEDPDWIATHAIIVYQVPGESANRVYPVSDWQANNWLADDTIPINQHIVQGGQMTSEAAQYALDLYLRRHASAGVQFEVTLGGDDRLLRYGGGLANGLAVTPGEWLSIAGRSSGTSVAGGEQARAWQITRKTLRTQGGKTTVTLAGGSAELAMDPFDRLFTDVARLKGKINVQSGGRERKTV